LGDGLARNALREALTEAGVCVVGQAADIPQVINLARRCQPDVVVIDADLPPDGGMAALEALLPASPGLPVVLLAETGEDDAGLAALANGAAGYLSRETDLSRLAQAVASVTTGEAAISRSMARRLVERLRSRSNSTSGMRPIKSALTTREWEVLDLMTAGASTADIAGRLVVTTDTVHSHVNHILKKLHAHSRAEAVEIAEQTR
jgi:DNA-binding NarL/FixJ family response regulator